MELLNLIKSRRSIRKYTKEKINHDIILSILEAARWAPSGLNNQPWKFKIITDTKKIEVLASFSKYKSNINSCNCLIIVFLDKNLSYNRTKDVQAIGACIQNILLQAHALKVGSCWIGEIINNRHKVEEFLQVKENLELMAVICLGRQKQNKVCSTRKPLKELLIK